MRLIKFRAFFKKNKDFPDYWIYSDEDEALFWDLMRDDLDRETLSQFTGLHDKNGKEIWEGDILQDSPTYKGVCKYSDEKASFYIDRNEFGTGGKGYLLSSMEAIGNIYENKELLK